MPADCLILIAALIIVQLPMPRLRLPRLPRPFAARRAAHLASVKARAVAANEALQQKAKADAFLARAYAQAEHDMRMARIEQAPQSAQLEEHYV